jgi:hypothetical protein
MVCDSWSCAPRVPEYLPAFQSFTFCAFCHSFWQNGEQ